MKKNPLYIKYLLTSVLSGFLLFSPVVSLGQSHEYEVNRQKMMFHALLYMDSLNVRQQNGEIWGNVLSSFQEESIYIVPLGGEKIEFFYVETPANGQVFIFGINMQAGNAYRLYGFMQSDVICLLDDLRDDFQPSREFSVCYLQSVLLKHGLYELYGPAIEDDIAHIEH